MTSINWQPTCTLEALHQRAKLLQQIRDFFLQRNILEVETPTLSQHAVTDAHIESIRSEFTNGTITQTVFCQTSPEYAMKRLLAAGSGSIFQICKAFRSDELGRYHNPEFTMLEWYHLDYDHHQLMDEMDELLQHVLQCSAALRLSYQNCFLQYLNIDPLTCSLEELKSIIHAQKIMDTSDFDRDTCLQLLMSHLIEPHLGLREPFFLYDFPASQAALAKMNPNNPLVANRFEVYIKGIEIANGFHELSNAEEQRQRFEKDLSLRQSLNRRPMEIDQRLLQALSHGLPNCSGVALGIDRLLMLKINASSISDVIAFPWDRA